MSSPRLSIIIATWNAARTLERCLASIVAQSFTDWELLISDGESSDETVNLIQKHQGRISWWRSSKDDGIYDAWNRALEHAKGEYVCFLGADDELESSQALATLFTAAAERRFDLITSRGRMVDPSRRKEEIFGSSWNYKRLGRRMVVCHPGLLHHRSLFERYGMFDTRYRIAGDLEFLLRLPEELETLDVEETTVIIELGGVSRKNILARLREQRIALSHCPRFGPVRAHLVWIDKLWRYPIARLFGISH
ncbi:MAG TPA: glycosyltransferase family 2 protein [Xanthomonadaceae bacterium]|nr:glycosyltransferase family 2 protein [Xanthomonadaceae bacterium]